jgi:hypothetical protein
MDNGPRNKSKLLKNLINKNLGKIIFTTPTTPQQNLVENLFQVKKNWRKKKVGILFSKELKT